jgi:hypothetical protein
MDTHHMLPPASHRDIFLKKQKVYMVIGIVVTMFILTLSLNLALSRTSWFGRAATPSGTGILSIENSYLFASPITAKATGEDFIRITVFLLTTEGIGISGQEVKIQSAKPLTVTSVAPVTDTFGRAIFDVSATTPGDHTITGEAQGAILPQKVSIVFQ